MGDLQSYALFNKDMPNPESTNPEPIEAEKEKYDPKAVAVAQVAAMRPFAILFLVRFHNRIISTEKFKGMQLVPVRQARVVVQKAKRILRILDELPVPSVKLPKNEGQQRQHSPEDD